MLAFSQILVPRQQDKLSLLFKESQKECLGYDWDAPDLQRARLGLNFHQWHLGLSSHGPFPDEMSFGISRQVSGVGKQYSQLLQSSRKPTKHSGDLGPLELS